MSFFRSRRETELEREIAHHLHHLAAEYERQGHSREEALQLAQKEFGGSAQVKENCRDERRGAWMNGLRQDLVFGTRMMRRTPVITIAAVLSLALAIGANTAIVSLTDLVLWRDLPVPEPQQLTLVNWQGQGFPREIADGASGSMRREDAVRVADFFSYRSFQGLRAAVSGRARLAAFQYPGSVSVSFAGRSTVAQRRPVSGDFFSTLRVRPQIGRLLSEDDDSYAATAAVVVSHRFWVRALGSDPGAIGRTVNINNKPYAIAGVLEPEFYGLFPGDSAEIYCPLKQAQTDGGQPRLEDDRYWGLQLVARRAEGVTDAQLRAALDAVFPTTWAAQPKDAAKAPKIRLDEGGRGLGFLRREFRNPLLVLGGLVGLLLVIACTNIANLLLARAVARQKEVAMRVSLGCSRGRLMRQFLTESALLALLGGAASILVGYATANLLGQFLAGRENFPIAVSLDWRILTMAGGITAAALAVFGLFPAWQASRLSNAAWIKQGPGSLGQGPRRRWDTGKLFVMAQMALSVVLVMTAIVFTRNLAAIESADPGFDRRNLVLFGTRPGTSGYEKAKLPQFYFDLERRLAATPGVAEVGLVAVRPMNIGGWWDSVRMAGQRESYSASINGVTPAYLPLYTSHLVAGRNLTRADLASDAKVAVISEDLARKLGGPDVLGGRLEFSDVPPGVKRKVFEVVGIAPAIAATSMKDRPYAVWLPFEKDRPEATVVLRTTLPPNAVLPAIRQTMREIDRNLPMVDTATMEEQISKGLQRERMFATLCNGFGTLALALSVVGLYGVIAFRTSRRRSEIGIRLALGALPKDVVAMVVREGLAVAALGMAMGVPVVWAGAKYVQKELSQAKPLDPGSLALALGTLFAGALVAVAAPALRAAALKPADALRQD
jgi:predicted permease